MKRRTIRKMLKIIGKTLTAVNLFVLFASVYALEANPGSWLPVWFAVIAFAYLAAVAYFKYVAE